MANHVLFTRPEYYRAAAPETLMQQRCPWKLERFNRRSPRRSKSKANGGRKDLILVTDPCSPWGRRWLFWIRRRTRRTHSLRRVEIAYRLRVRSRGLLAEEISYRNAKETKQNLPDLAGANSFGIAGRRMAVGGSFADRIEGDRNARWQITANKLSYDRDEGLYVAEGSGDHEGWPGAKSQRGPLQ